MDQMNLEGVFSKYQKGTNSYSWVQIQIDCLHDGKHRRFELFCDPIIFDVKFNTQSVSYVAVGAIETSR